jgi:NTP pyrophosphatase (non-canonical NTP hydrolase)
MNFQKRVKLWSDECFGPEISMDKTERNQRFLEEALELVQSAGLLKEDALQLVDYVYDRPVGELEQEIGGTMVTLAALCNAHNIDLEAVSDVEVDRIWQKVDQIREKQKNKPKFSALPM